MATIAQYTAAVQQVNDRNTVTRSLTDDSEFTIVTLSILTAIFPGEPGLASVLY